MAAAARRAGCARARRRAEGRARFRRPFRRPRSRPARQRASGSGALRAREHVAHVQEVERRRVQVAELLEVVVVAVAARAIEKLHVVAPLDRVVRADVLEPREDVRARKEQRAPRRRRGRSRLAPWRKRSSGVSGKSSAGRVQAIGGRATGRAARRRRGASGPDEGLGPRRVAQARTARREPEHGEDDGGCIVWKRRPPSRAAAREHVDVEPERRRAEDRRRERGPPLDRGRSLAGPALAGRARWRRSIGSASATQRVEPQRKDVAEQRAAREDLGERPDADGLAEADERDRPEDRLAARPRPSPDGGRAAPRAT